MSSDLSSIIDRLDSRSLRARLQKLEQQRSALIVFLRAALARERKAKPKGERRGKYASN